MSSVDLQVTARTVIDNAKQAVIIHNLVHNKTSNNLFGKSVKNKFVKNLVRMYKRSSVDATEDDFTAIEWLMTDYDSIEIADGKMTLIWDSEDGTIISLEVFLVYVKGTWVSTGIFEIASNEPAIIFESPDAAPWFTLVAAKHVI